MTGRVLFVDDDPGILNAFRRRLYKKFDLVTAEGPKEGLDSLAGEGPFAVVVSDQKMPEMDGVTFLSEVRNRAPDAIRIMLTGNADQQTAVEAINEGHIFRFLNKPCSPDQLSAAIDAALAQHRLITGERELLEKTLAGSVKVLVDVLTLRDPETFAQTSRLREWGRRLADHMNWEDGWALDMTIMLSSIGRITLPAALTAKLDAGADLTEDERAMVAQTPQVAHDLIANIPRMEPIATAVRYQSKGFDGSGFPDDETSGEAIPKNARVLRILADLAAASGGDEPGAAAFAALEAESRLHDPEILVAARDCLLAAEDNEAEEAPKLERLEVPVYLLRPDDRLDADIMCSDGSLVLSSGHRLSPAMLTKIRQINKINPVAEPVPVIREVAAE